MENEKTKLMSEICEIYKDGFGDGPWNDEPTLIEPEFFEYKKYVCAIRRNLAMGHLMGYVLLKEKPNDKQLNIFSTVNVHGGITWNRPDFPMECDKPHAWVIGFDCAHLDDLTPALRVIHKINQSRRTKSCQDYVNEFLSRRTYKTVTFVKKELKKLVNQLIKEKIQ